MHRLLKTVLLALFVCWGTHAGAAEFAGRYYLQNVGSELWWGCGNSWSTQASLMPHPEYVVLAALPDGTYTMETQVNNGGTQYYFNGSFMDNGTALALTITPVADGIYTISDGSALFGYNGSSTVLAGGLSNASDVNAQWRILSESDMRTRLLTATAEHPVDATYLIMDPHFGRNNRNLDSWTMDASNKNLAGGTNENFCAESWRSTFTLSQSLSVPNGIYRLRAQGFYQNYTDDYDNLPVFYANSVSTTFPERTGSEASMGAAAESFMAGLYWIEPMEVEVLDGTLVIGARNSVNTQLWCIFDNFELTYYGMNGDDLSGYAAALTATMARAHALEGSIPAAAWQALSAVLQDIKETYDTKEKYNDAINTIEDAIAQYAPASLQSAYARYNTLKQKAQQLAADTEVYASGALDLSTADAAVEASFTFEEVDNAIALLYDAVGAFLGSAEIRDGKYFDVTDFYLNNPSPYANGEGWTLSAYSIFDETMRCAEFWQQQGAVISQHVANVPKGSYRLVATAFTRTDMQAVLQAGEAQMNIATVESDIVNNRTEANAWFNEGNGVNELYFYHAANGDIDISLTADDNNPDYWLVWRSFELQYIGGDESTLYKQQLAKALADAQATRATVDGKCPKPVLGVLDEAIAAGQQSYASVDDYKRVMAQIEAAKAKASEVSVAYVAYQEMRVVVGAILQTEGLAEKTEGAISTFETVLGQSDAAVEAATSTDDVEQAKTQLRAAALALVAGIRPADGYPVDLTFLLENPDFEQGGVATQGILPGWTCTFVSGETATNIGYQPNAYADGSLAEDNAYKNGDIWIRHFIEAWQQNSDPYVVLDGELYQRLAGLPVGRYRLTNDAIAVNQWDESQNPVTGTYIYIKSGAIETRTEIHTGNGVPEHFEVDFLCDYADDMDFGLKTVNTTANWIAADNFHIYFLEALDESPGVVALKTALEQYDDVTLTAPSAVAARTTFETQLQLAREMVTTDLYSATHSAECIAQIDVLADAYAALQASETQFASFQKKVKSIRKLKNSEWDDSPVRDGIDQLADELQGYIDRGTATTKIFADCQQRADSVVTYWMTHLVEAEQTRLAQAATTLGRSIDTYDTTSGFVTGINLSQCGLNGSFPVSAFNMPHLSYLNLSGNSINDVDADWADELTVDLTNQTYAEPVVFDLPTVEDGSISAQLPPLLMFSHEEGGQTGKFKIYAAAPDDDSDQKWEILLENVSYGVMYFTHNEHFVFRGKSGDTFTCQSYYGDAAGSTFPLRVTFEQGDASFDGLIDISDLQSIINYFFDDLDAEATFNFTAADLWTDGIINVQDVVREVDLLLGQPVAPKSAPARAPRRILRDGHAPQATLAFADGRLVLDSESPVTALDIAVNTPGSIDWSPLKALGFVVTERRTTTGTRIIAYSLDGAEVPAGMTILANADAQAKLVGASLADGAARSVAVTLDGQLETGINGLADGDSSATVRSVYDLGGRKLNNRLPQHGAYIVNGRKVIK